MVYWSHNYRKLVSRNLGYLNMVDQQRIKDATVAVLGVGGLGGVVAEVLVRSGLGHIKILDYDKFDSTNRNRQIFSYRSTQGKNKVSATKKFLLDINPELKVEEYFEINRNIIELLMCSDVVVLALDGIRGYIEVARKARILDIPVVESWAAPFGVVRVLTRKTPSLESIYDLPTKGKDLGKFTDKELDDMHKGNVATLLSIWGMGSYNSKLAVSSTFPSFAPFVWLNACLMAHEVVKIITKKGSIAYAPKYAVYDAIKHSIPKQIAVSGFRTRIMKSMLSIGPKKHASSIPLPDSWSDQYRMLVQRNIGYLSPQQQEKLRKSTVAVLGLGSIGGISSEILARSGIGNIVLVDNSRFKPTNLNRQIHCFRSKIDQQKIKVTKKILKDINPELNIKAYGSICSGNVKKVLGDADIAILGLDGVKELVIASRFARENNIPLVEAWSIAIGNVKVFDRRTIDMEDFYDLPTVGRDLDSFSKEDYGMMFLKMMTTFAAISGVQKFYTPHILKEQYSGTFEPGIFATTALLNGILVAIEAIKVLLDFGKIAYAPLYALYDPFSHKIPSQFQLGSFRTRIWKSYMQKYLWWHFRR